jgi:hypothetical protein
VAAEKSPATSLPREPRTPCRSERKPLLRAGEHIRTELTQPFDPAVPGGEHP